MTTKNRMGVPRPGRVLRQGVSLIEVMVALTLFALIASVHTVATMRYGFQARVVALGQARALAVATAADMYSTMPRGAIAGTVGCTTVTDLPEFPHQRCVSTSAVNASITRVMIRIVPTNAALTPDTVTVDRVTGAANSVFN